MESPYVILLEEDIHNFLLLLLKDYKPSFRIWNIICVTQMYEYITYYKFCNMSTTSPVIDIRTRRLIHLLYNIFAGLSDFRNNFCKKLFDRT